MTANLNSLACYISSLKESIKYCVRWQYFWRDWYLGRHACLGYEVLKYYQSLPRVVNFQKGRADLLAQYWSNFNLLPKSARVEKFMTRFDLPVLVRQLEFFDCLPRSAPKFIFMDSFAELTDQMFINRSEHWRFCSGYSDINHVEEFSNQFYSEGLLPVEKIKQAYLNLFNIFEERWGASVPIYFLHFPIALEKREIFRNRYQEIVRIVNEIALERPNLHPIRIDESGIQMPEDAPQELKEFPYHYDESAYKLFKQKIEEVKPLNG